MITQGVLRDVLLPYQMRWVDDGARYKIGMWSRQTGKSFATSAEAVVDCQLRPGQLWVCLSAGERQAFEWLRKARQWSEAVELAMSGYSELSDAAEVINMNNRTAEMNRKALEYAEKHSLAKTSGSDIHRVSGFCGGGMAFDHRLTGPKDFIESVKSGNCELLGNLI